MANQANRDINNHIDAHHDYNCYTITNREQHDHNHDHNHVHVAK